MAKYCEGAIQNAWYVLVVYHGINTCQKECFPHKDVVDLRIYASKI